METKKKPSVAEKRGIRLVLDCPPDLVELLDALKVVWGFTTRNKVLGWLIEDATVRVGTAINPHRSPISKEQKRAVRKCRKFAGIFQDRLLNLADGLYDKPQFALVPLPHFPKTFDQAQSTKKKRTA